MKPCPDRTDDKAVKRSCQGTSGNDQAHADDVDPVELEGRALDHADESPRRGHDDAPDHEHTGELDDLVFERIKALPFLMRACTLSEATDWYPRDTYRVLLCRSRPSGTPFMRPNN